MNHTFGKSLRFVCQEVVDCFSVFATEETFREHKADCFLRSSSETSFNSALEHAQRVQQMKYFYANYSWRAWQQERTINILQTNSEMKKRDLPKHLTGEWGLDQNDIIELARQLRRGKNTPWKKIFKRLKQEKLLSNHFFLYCQTNHLDESDVLSDPARASSCLRISAA